MYFDSHCHINNYKYSGEEEAYIIAANKANVTSFVVVGWDIASSKAAIKLAEEFSGVYAAVGIHPVDSVKTDPGDLKELEKLLVHPKVVALGEIGLDYHWIKDETERELQKTFFIQQLALANKFKKPVIIHMRNATNETYLVLKEHRAQYKGVMHSYSGPAEMVKDFLDLDFYIGLGGPVTFLNAKTPKEVAKVVPIDRLLIETDSPYLTPHPYRGKTNGSHLLPLIAKEIANIKRLSVTDIGAKTTYNAKKLFGLVK
ncbi:MAG TPA: TatD family hydrolase [Bacilli bacterium]|nr:TatD family hydrolase [Bacilli bacterium]